MSSPINRTNLRLATANIILVANAFVWYLIAFNTLKDLLLQANASSYDSLIIMGVNTGAMALSGLLGSFLSDRYKRQGVFLYFWLVGGIALSLVPLGLEATNINNIAFISAIFGLYFGLGMPATMGYHSTVTTVENRARISGLAFLFIGVIFALAGLVIFDTLLASCLILAFIRFTGWLIFHFLHGKEEPRREPVKVKFTSIISNKSFILYFIPWCMFTLVNYMTIPILKMITEINYNFLMVAENIVIAFFAIASGFIADKWGRKRLTIIGFTMLGMGYAVIGLFSLTPVNMVWGSIIYVIADGVAWGIFYVLFIFTLWGDLAQNKISDKFYFLGALPYVSSYFMQLLFTPYLSGILPTMIFSFASIFLFLAILPLVYAPETLPEKIMKDRDLKSYIEKAKKKAQKNSAEKHKKEEKGNIGANEKTREPKHEDYEDAVKLAEKYY